jgi:hypothetical protein
MSSPASSTHCSASCEYGLYIIFLDEIAARHPQNLIIMVMDDAGWHRSATLMTPIDMRLLGSAPYSPELDPVEHIWDELREMYFHTKVFNSIEALEDQRAVGLLAFEQDRNHVKSIVACDWIVNALLN